MVERPGALADEHFFARAVRVACIVGGACGMAMIFDSPLGGILYMPLGRDAVAERPLTICNMVRQS